MSDYMKEMERLIDEVARLKWSEAIYDASGSYIQARNDREAADEARAALLAHAAQADHDAPVELPEPEAIERIATTRYRCVPIRLFGYKVVSGDGDRSLFEGTKDECYVVARKLTEAFLDGAHVAFRQMHQYGDAREAAGYARAMAQKGGE